MSKLILFATYWNAIDWIDTSLEQIREINPDEAIICDGCFDLKREIHSTDGTLEKIIKFVDSNKNFQFTPPIRHNKCTGILKLFSYLALERSLIKILRPSNYNIIARAAIFCHHYRINQALTFNKMISMSKHWSPGNWFMTYDADQYYSNDLLCKFKNLESEHSDLVCAQELTFFHDFENFTTEYGEHTRFIELAGEINTKMPDYVVKQAIEKLNEVGKSVKGARVLLLGLAYKANVDDDRESPSYVIMEKLEHLGAIVEYNDPHIPVIRPSREYSKYAGKKSVEISSDFDLIILVTNHEQYSSRLSLLNEVEFLDARGRVKLTNASCVS